MVKYSPADAEDMVSVLGLGRSPMPHSRYAPVPRLLKPAGLEPMLRNKRSHRNKKPVPNSEQEPQLAASRKRPGEATKTQHSQK